MKALISGLLNVETTVKIREFPIEYAPIDFPFFGIRSGVSGVAFNIAKALRSLDNKVRVASFIGNDFEGKRVMETLTADGTDAGLIRTELRETPVSTVLYDESGRRRIYCDLKDIQEQTMDISRIADAVAECDVAVLCNINFNRNLLREVKKLGKPIASDVHVLGDINDEFNRDFMECADILFLSDENLPCAAEEFILRLKDVYPPKIIVIGRGEKGAMMYERESDSVYTLNAANIGGVVNTVGAGDALFSAFLSFYFGGFPAVEALVRAEVFAALKIRHNGASVGFPNIAEVEEIYHDHRSSIVP